MTLFTLMVLAPFIFGAAAFFSAKVAFSKWGGERKEDGVQWLVATIVSITSSVFALVAAAQLLDLAPTLIKQEHIATQVIRVLDEHGWEEACKHIDCQGLVDRALESKE